MIRRQLPLIFTVAWIAALFGVSGVLAGYDNSPTTLYLSERHDARPVDNATWCGDCGGVDYTTGSPWTINPGWVPGYTPPIIAPRGGGTAVEEGCLWDSDDYFFYQTSGNVLGANTTLTLTECNWWTYNSASGGRINYVVFHSSSPDLIIKYRWDWDAGSRSYTLPAPVRDGTSWLYHTCLAHPQPEGATIIDVPGSHDGHAGWQLETVTITNPTGRKTSKTGGFIGSDARDYLLYCQGGPIEV